MAVRLQGAGDIEVQRAYQWSDDGIEWSGAATAFSSWESGEGWSYPGSNAWESLSGPKIFVRFGVLVRNDTGTRIDGALVSAELDVKAVASTMAVAGPIQVHSGGEPSDTNAAFSPITAHIDSERVTAIRRILGTAQNSGNCVVKAGYQVSDDGITWYSGEASASAGSFSVFGSQVSGDDLDYGTSFTAFNPNEKKRLVRFGVAAWNSSGTKVEACNATLRVDMR